MSKHSYLIGCTCERCTREATRRAAQAASDPRPRQHTRARSRVASRAEQHARYIDCGYQAWDDKG